MFTSCEYSICYSSLL